jgi:hypothetical protein
MQVARLNSTASNKIIGQELMRFLNWIMPYGLHSYAHLHMLAVSHQKWGSSLQSLQLSLPKVQKIKTVRPGPEPSVAAEVRETPRLVVDSLKVGAKR